MKVHKEYRKLFLASDKYLNGCKDRHGDNPELEAKALKKMASAVKAIKKLSKPIKGLKEAGERE